MKTRIIQTRFWDDDTVSKVSKDAKLLWIYLLTNKELGMTNYIRIPDALICYFTQLTANELQKAKQELQSTKKIFFHEEWIFIPKLESQNKYKNSPSNEATYERELSYVPQEIKAYFNNLFKNINTSTDSTVTTSVDSTYKSEIRNKKQEIRNKKSEFEFSLLRIKSEKDTVVSEAIKLYPNKNCEHAMQDFLEYCAIKGPRYKNYKLAYLRWVREDKFNKYAKFNSTPKRLGTNTQSLESTRELFKKRGYNVDI